MGSPPLRISDALNGVRLLGIETAPFIYFVERHPTYVDRMRAIIRLVDEGTVSAVSSTVTLTEVLTQRIKQGNKTIEQAYRDILLKSRNFRLAPISAPTAERAAQLRARYNLKTPDALQVAAAIDAGCDAFLTNDLGLRRVTELQVLVLDDLEFDPAPGP